jgi:hypothetical protein
MEELVKYVRDHRPMEDDPLLFDREIRLMLNWLDTHRVRERAVFEAQEGKEYIAMLQFVEERTAVTDFKVDTELFQLLLGASGPSSASGVASGASSAAGGGSLRQRKRRLRRM